MQPKSSHDGADEDLNRQQMPLQWPTRRPWSRFHHLSVPHLSGRSGKTQTAPSQLPACSEKVSALGIPTVSRFSGFTLPDLDSATGIYINDELVQATVLEHLSEFRVGSSLLLVTVLRNVRSTQR